MNFFWIQLIGAVGYGSLAYSYYKKEKKQILFIQIISYIMFTIHYYLLNGLTGAICNFIGLLALVAIYLFDKYKWNYKNLVGMLFAIILIIINITTFQNFFSIFPMVASVIVIISFLVDNENVIRGVGLIAAVCWLVYAIVVKSYVAIAFEVITLAGVAGAYMKNTKKKDNKKLRK